MITDASIKSAIKSVATELTLTDKGAGKGAGSLQLVVRRLSTGGVSARWYARVVRDGKRNKKSIGQYPEMTLAMARQHMITEVSPALRQGRSLRATYSGDKPTVERLFQAYVNTMKANGRVSAGDVEHALLLRKDNAADALGRTRMASDVTADEVVDFVRMFFKRGTRATADKMRSYISSAYAWAMRSANDYTNDNAKDWGIRSNPAAEIPRDRKAISARDRNLSAEELAALWKATEPGAEGFSMETAVCIRMLICCGQRVQETLRIDGVEIDISGKLWEMPAEKTKLGTRPHLVPLPDHAVEVLKVLADFRGDGALFVARMDGKNEIMDHRAVNRAIKRWLDEQDAIAHFTSRDLRRTWKSRAHDAGIDRFTRDLIQQHTAGDTGSKHYDRAEYLPQKREAMDKWNAWLESNVVNPQPQITDQAA